MYMYIYRVHQPDKPMVSVGETNSQLAARLFQLKGNKNSALSSDCMTIMGMSDASWQMLKGISESLGWGPSSDKTSGEGFQEGLIIQYHSCMILWFCYCTHCCALCRQNLNINHGDVGPASCGKKRFDSHVMLMLVSAESLHPFSHAKAFNFWHVIGAPNGTPVHSNALFFYA